MDRCINLERKRGLFDIIASLLEVLESGACSKTTMASRANLATRGSRKYVNMILGFNLIVKDEDRNFFKITEKGRRFLEEYRRLKMFIEE